MVQQVTYAGQQTKKYHIALHPATFATKEEFNMAFITAWFKKKGRSDLYTLEEIFEFCSNGRCIIPSHIEPNDDGTNYRFISSKLMFVDIDDDNKETDPHEVLKQLSEVCAGLFFTPSHGIKGNRYRLVFVLDDYVRNEREYQKIFKMLVEQLVSLGIPADGMANSALRPMRTGTRGHIISNVDAVYSIAQARKAIERKEETELKQRAKAFQEKVDKNYRVYSFEELKARAEVIGYVEDIHTWHKMGHSIWSYVREGFIDEIEGFEIFTILCGGNDESEKWQQLSNPTRITIGTFIQYSDEMGFKLKDEYKYYHAAGSDQSNLKVQKVKFEQYISLEYAKSLLVEEKNILFKSPTGSGKTKNFISAAKELAEELRQKNRTRFFIFAVPTIAICDQVANDYDILAVRGTDPQKKKSIQSSVEPKETGGFIIRYDDVLDIESSTYHKLLNYYDEGNRVIVCTYDMAEAVYNMLEDIRPLSSYGLIVDEYHQFTSAYEYRHKAIESVHSLVDSMKSFIALSGTPDDILKEPFDYEVHVSTKHEKAPCQMWGAITYEKMSDEEPMLFELIKSKVRKDGSKLLVFIQSKEMIKRLKGLLDDEGINTATVDSDGKKDNPTYSTIVNESRFPANVDVILTTSVLSDGINIKNEKGAKYDCILVASQKSNLFDVAQVRQCANRFRNTYRSFMVYMLSARVRSQFFYNIESAYRYEKRLAMSAVDMLNTEFKGKDNHKLMSMGVLEKRYGIKLDDNAKAHYNALKLRYNVAEEKKQFYFKFRNEFIVALTKLMGCNPTPTVNISEAIKKAGIDISEVAEEIEELKETAKLSRQEKINQFGLHFTQRVYNAFKVESAENDEILKEFKKAVISEQFSCLKGIASFADYHTCLKIAKQVTRQADINKFKKYVEGFVNVCHYKAIDRKEPTRKVYFALAEHLNEVYESAGELKNMVMSVGRDTKVSKTVSTEEVATYYFYTEKNRTGENKGHTLRELTIEHIAQMFDLECDQVSEVVMKYAVNRGGKTAEVVMKNMTK